MKEEKISWASSDELQLFDDMLNSDLSNISKEELKHLTRYHQALKDSHDINLYLTSSATHPLDVGQMAFSKAKQLADGEFLLFDVGTPTHSMRMSVRRIHDKMEITLYDTSGGLQAYTSNPPEKNKFEGRLKKPLALRTSIPIDDFQKNGRAHLTQIFSISLEPCATRMAQLPADENFHSFLRIFQSISSHWELMATQVPQQGWNCFEARIRTTEKEILGTALAQKVRIFTLRRTYSELIKIAKGTLTEKITRNFIRDFSKHPRT